MFLPHKVAEHGSFGYTVLSFRVKDTKRAVMESLLMTKERC